MQFLRSIRALAIAALIVLNGPFSESARAAGGAFAVDDAGLSPANTCKLESWISVANNSPPDRAGVTAPSCTVFPEQPVELGVQLARARSGGSYATGLALFGKTAIVPMENRNFGIAILARGSFDLTSSALNSASVTFPISLKIADPLQINFNLGLLNDSAVNRTHAAWGAGLEWMFASKWTLLTEVFGHEGERARTQIGLRFTPYEKMDIDLIYGHNLTGEQADWLTVGVNLRF